MLTLLKHNGKNASLALAFGGLMVLLEILIRHQVTDVVSVVCAVMTSYILADKSAWLTESVGTPSRLGRGGVILAAFALVALLYLMAADGRGIPLTPALYLPLVLAVLWYRAEAGLGLSALTAVLYLWNVSRIHPGHTVLSIQDLSAVISFPAVALFVRLLLRRTEDRFRALDDRTSELSALLDMSQMMDSAPDLETTLNLVLLNVQRLSACQVCAVYLTQRGRDTLDLRAASGPRNRMALMPALSIEEARSGQWSIDDTTQSESGVSALYVADTESDPARRFSPRLYELDHRARSFACVPLASVEGLLGLLYVSYDEPDGLDGDSVRRLEHLAVRAAFSLQRAVMQQGYRSLAYSDAMTGLDNFRQFEQDLGHELSRAQRYNRALSVILLDIDHFKKFNDTLGHQAGDALLAQMAGVLRDSLRSVDKPARYGGEEFVVICPETGPDEARLIAERIRRNVESTAFALLGEGAPGAAAGGTAQVTISVGFATFPDAALAARDLVKCADDALYAAKHAGRNTVCGYEYLHPGTHSHPECVAV